MSVKPLSIDRSLERNARSFNDAKRIQESITSRWERKALLWLAARIPARVNSDHLTLLGFAAMVLAGGSYAWAAGTGPVCCSRLCVWH